MSSFLPHILLSLVVTFGMGGCKSAAAKQEGSGIAKSEVRPVSGFKKVKLAGVGKLTLRQTSKESLTVQAEENVLPLIETKVEGDTLTLALAKNVNLSTSTSITFDVEAKTLELIDLSGAGSIEATDINADKLSLQVSGTGRVNAAGKADAVEVSLSGVGSLDAQRLVARQARVDNSGAGRVIVNATGVLDARVSGVGSIKYVGNPDLKSSVSGIGKIERL